MARRRHTPEQVIRKLREWPASRRGRRGRGCGPAPGNLRGGLLPVAGTVWRDEGRGRKAAEGAGGENARL